MALIKLLIVMTLVSPCTWHVSAQSVVSDGLVESRYDRFDDRTYLRLRLSLRPTTSLDGTLTLLLESWFEKDGALKPVKLTFSLTSKTRRFPFPTRFNAIVDDSRLRLTNDETAASFDQVDLQRGNIHQRAYVVLDSFNLLAMAKGKKVEGRIGATEFQLTAAQLILLTEFTKQTAKRQTELNKANAKRQAEMNETITNLEKQIERLNGGLEKSKEEDRVLLNMERLTRAEQRAASLGEQLRNVKEKEDDLHSRSKEIEDELRPEKLENYPKDSRDDHRRQLIREQDRINAQLSILSDSEARLKAALAQANKEVELLRAQPTP